MIKFLSFLCLLTSVLQAGAQDFSNKGKDFWISYPAHNEGTSSVMGIYITSDVAATGTITVGTTVLPFNLAANAVVRKFVGPGGDVSNAAVYMGITDGIQPGAGIHIVSDHSVAVYAHIIRQQRSGASLILPANVWGKEYIAPNHRNTGVANGIGEINVMASKPNTTVEIIPKVNSLTGARPAGVPFQITLVNPGDVYQLQFASNLDLSGTSIKSVSSATEPCKPIAVFSASTYTGMDCNSAQGGDNLYQQLFPTSSWGKQFLTSPLKKGQTINDQNTDIIKVFVTDPSTIVTKVEAGTSTTLTGLIAGSYYQFQSYQPTQIQADKPIQVVQYITSYLCGSPQTDSDPEMIILSSVEQTTNNITVFSAHVSYVPPGQSVISSHFLNIIMKTNNMASFRINGIAPQAAFNPIPGTGYSYLKENLTARAGANPVFTLSADSGFSAIAYGFGDAESYGYNAGTNVKDLYQQIGVFSLYGIETVPSVCVGSPFKFKVSLPYQADSMYWDLSPEYPPVWQLPTAPATSLAFDSMRIVNDKTIYWYSLPTFYNYPIVGTYPIQIKTYFSGNLDGCGNEQEIDFDLQVSSPPAIDFYWQHNGCINESVQFRDTTISAKPTYSWWWDFGDPASGAANHSNVKHPLHQFSAPGTYTIRYANITTPGCLSDTLEKQITIQPLPTATIAGTTDVCVNAAEPSISFTGNLGATSAYIFTYTINGGAAQTVTSTTATVLIPVPTTSPGSFVYELISVQNLQCIQAQTGIATVNVHALPTATITGNTTVCLNAPAATLQFTATNGIPPYSFSYNLNGGPPQTITSTTGNVATLLVPTNVVGNFTYNLLSVTDGSAVACTQPQSGSATVIVKDLPVATIQGAAVVCINSASPQVIFTGSNGTSPYTFSYQVNAGPVQTVSSSASSASATVQVPTGTSGNFEYTLLQVQEGSSSACMQVQTGTANFTVAPLPIASFVATAAFCAGNDIQFTDVSTTVEGSINSWVWNFGDPSSANNNSTDQHPVHVFSMPGSYTVSLTVSTDDGCISNLFSQTIIIHDNPSAGFVIPEVCLSDPFALFTDSSSSTAGIQTWLWNFGDVNATGTNPNNSAVQHAQHAYIAVGDYAVSLIATDNNGCADTIVQTLTINGGDPVSDFVLLSGNAICATDSIALQNKSVINSGSITKVEIYWDNDNAPTQFETDEDPAFDKIYAHAYPVFNSPASKVYAVRMRAYSGNTCFEDKIVQVTVHAIPNVVFNAIPSLCMNEPSFTLNQASETGAVPGPPGVYTGVGVSAGNVFDPMVAGEGTHTILFTFTSTQGCMDTASQTIRVYPVPLVDAGPDKTILQGGSVVLDPSITAVNPTYAWTPADHLSATDVSSPICSTPVDISYVIMVTGEGNCTASDELFVKVLLAPKIPNTFSPNSDGINDHWVISYLDTYPGNRVQVFTRTGAKVFESIGYTKPWDGTMKGKSLPIDTYYYLIEPGNGLKPITGYVTIVK